MTEDTKDFLFSLIIIIIIIIITISKSNYSILKNGSFIGPSKSMFELFPTETQQSVLMFTKLTARQMPVVKFLIAGLFLSLYICSKTMSAKRSWPFAVVENAKVAH